MTRDEATDELKPPILVIGGTRSGTSMMVRLLGEAPGVHSWYEPETIWRIGHAYRSHSRADASDAKPWVRRRIRREFLKQQRLVGGDRLIEKSPSNALRVAFCHAAFPDAKIVHIYRDGRSMLRSQLNKYEKFRSYEVATDSKARSHVLGRLRRTPWWEWGAYAPRFLDGLWRRYVTRKPMGFFGIRTPGWKKDRDTLGRVQLIAKQWALCLEYALPELEALPDDSWINLKYEDVVRDPVTHFREVTEFCGIDAPESYFEMIRETVKDNSLGRNWARDLDPEVVEQAMPIMEPMLRQLGYLDNEQNAAQQPAEEAQHAEH